ncbi:MAG: hypothetical protein ACREN2_08725 [Candidatus Dormibacteria bacterium]
MVPPPDILQQEHVPDAPAVKNMTNGAVSQTDAQHWANANNWATGWLKWADENDQPVVLSAVVGDAVLAVSQEQAMQSGAAIHDPDCIYVQSATLFPLGVDGKAYFARKNLPTDYDYVFVVTFNGPCASTATYPDGHSAVLPGTTGPITAFVPGTLRHDQLLGDIWYTDAGGDCHDPNGPPPEWCGR